MLTICIIVIFAYVIVFIFLIYGWIKIDKLPNHNSYKFLKFSIIIPFRNEQKNLKNLFESLCKVNYDPNFFEVIFVDDNSEDNGNFILTQLFLGYKSSNFKILKSDGNGKKYALFTGIKNSKFDYIITTDSDCQVPTNWLRILNDFILSKNLLMVTMPVVYSTKNIWQKILNFELLGLVAIGASSLRNGFPTMANGANLAFHKTTFFELGAYEDNIKIPSGDDEFLLHKFCAKYPDRVKFLPSNEVVVYTNPPQIFSEFIHQRLRWSSKWKYYKNVKNALPPIYLVILNLLIVISFFSYDFGWILFAIKSLMDFIFMGLVLTHFKKKNLLLYGIIFQFFYLFYILFFAFLSLFKRKYVWKGRLN